MRGNYKITVIATTYPVDLTYVKEHTKVDYTDEDTVLLGYLKAAIEEAEQYTNRGFCEQTIKQVVDRFPGYNVHNEFGELELFRAPLMELATVKYWNNEDTPVLTTLYDKDGSAEQQAAVIWNDTKAPATIFPKAGTLWPTTGNRPAAIEIVYKAGFAASFIPEIAKQAICLLTASHYENREDAARKYKSRAMDLLDKIVVHGW